MCFQKAIRCDEPASKTSMNAVKNFSNAGEGDSRSQSENFCSFHRPHFTRPPLHRAAEQIQPAPFGRKSSPFQALDMNKNIITSTAASGEDNLGIQLHNMEMRLDEIADLVGAKSRNATEDKLEECKRLKEKLKSALELEKLQLRIFEQKETWMDYIFGICKPDGRVGKMGSKWVSSSWLIHNDIALTCGVGEYHHLQPNPPAITLYAR